MTPLTVHTDAELVSMLNRGDRKALKIIYRTHVSDLYKYARSLITSKEDCEEIIQDVFEKLWTLRDSIRIESIRQYLLRAVKNKVLNYIKHNAVKKKYADHYKFFSAIYDSMDEREQNTEVIYQIMEQGIQKLPEKLQRVIKLRMNENLSNTEIADRLNLTWGSVDIYMHRINLRLRQAYKDFYKTSS